MATYCVTGKLGSGKSLASVGKIRDALIAGKRVVTNLDLYLRHMLGPRSKARYIRIPDKPTVFDFEAIGLGQEEFETLDDGTRVFDEDKNGLIVLDELASWMNARSWGDKERGPVLDWLIHSRKKGWDVVFICQNLSQIDKQIRDSLVEHHVVCRRLDRLGIPIVSSLLGIRLPKIHLGIVKYGTDINSLIVDRWWYRAKDLYRAYNTRQIFLEPQLVNGVKVPHVGLHTVLSPWDLGGSKLGPPVTLRDLPRIVLSALYLGLARLFIALGMLTPAQAFPHPRPAAQRPSGGREAGAMGNAVRRRWTMDMHRASGQPGQSVAGRAG